MITKGILEAARTLISDPERWTTGDYALDADGNSVLPVSPRAACWCALGAIDRASHYAAGHDEFLEHATVLRELQKTVRQDLGFTSIGGIVDYNDTATHDQVLELFDRTIERLS